MCLTSFLKKLPEKWKHLELNQYTQVTLPQFHLLKKNQKFLFWGFLSFVRKALKKVKITGLKHHYDNFNKKVDISDEEKTETQWCINNIDKAFETLEAIFNMHLKWKIHQNN